MIIIEGPDQTGKSTLAKALSKKYNISYLHFTKDSAYEDYLPVICNPNVDCVADRWIFSEYPYSRLINRKFAFTNKQWHNIILLTLAHNPLIILCTHKPSIEEYSKDQYLPYDKFDGCLELYRQFFDEHHIRYIEYDYSNQISLGALAILEQRHMKEVAWWEPMWRAGYGYIGSRYPKILLVAERIGPNNINNLPFETGPTGYMLSDMLEQTSTPLGLFAVTNMVKSFRRDTRPPNNQDKELLKIELEHLKPEIAVFMGNVAKQHGTAVAKQFGIKTAGMTHFGYFHHRRITNLKPMYNQWKQILSCVKEGENGQT